MTLPDPRTHAYRPDLADLSLSGIVEALRYIEPTLRQCVRGIVPLLAAPNAKAPLVSQIRYGEFIDVFETRNDGYVWVQNRTDRYVGYMPSENTMSEEIADLSSRIGILKTFVYAEPNIKSPVLDTLTLGSYVKPLQQEGKMVALLGGGYVYADHVLPASESLTSDYVFTAGRLLHTPYLWGGRSANGIDCSGLVQLALELSGRDDCPRDADQQCETYGKTLPCHWRDVAWKRGDLVFVKGHVGIMTGPDHIIHASGHHMQVVVEPLTDFVLGRGNEIAAAGRL
ncbi:MAG: NlpC/P60 family protein [Bdellovibrionales bacterium]